MSDLDQFRELADQVRPPSLDSLRETARRRDRRAAVTAATLAATTVALLIAGMVVVRGLEPTTPHPVSPVQTPTEPPTEGPKQPHSPNSMTPQEVVNAPDADLVIVALAPGDPDVRLSTWTALCHWCPDTPDGRGGSLGPPTFTGMALTTDGYETTTYVRPRNPQLAYTVLSPRDDVFLLNDEGNGREWLVDVDDGTERRVARVDSELRPADPRLWFECGIARGDSSTWCSLDVDTATAYAWPEAWSGSAVAPYVGDEPWGWEPPGWSRTSTGTFEDDPSNTGTYDDPGGTYEAWWDTNGSRQRRPFTTDEMGTIGGSTPGELAYWTRRLGSDTLDLHTGRDRGAVWEVETRAAPGFSRGIQMMRSPDGALLAWTEYPRLVVWRAEASGGGFRQVHEASGPETYGGGLWAQDDVVYANGNGSAAVSDDDGLTWTTIDSWR